MIARFVEDDKAFKPVDEWVGNGVVVLDELYDLVDMAPDIDKVRWTEVDFESQTHLGKEKDYVARIDHQRNFRHLRQRQAD